MGLGHRGGEIVDSDSILTCDSDGGLGIASPTIEKNSEKKHALKATQIVADATNGDHLKLVEDNGEVFSRIKLVESDGKVSAETAGINMAFLMVSTDTATQVGNRIIGAGNGFVKGVGRPNVAAAAPTKAEYDALRLWNSGRGRITKIYESGGKKYCITNFRS